MCAALIGLVLVNGCAGKQEVITLDVAAIPSGLSGALSREDLKALVIPFEDKQAQTRVIGSRSHIGGGRTYFTVANNRPGEAVARVLADYLKQKGWQTWVVKPGGPVVANPAGGLDVTLSGEVLEFSANAKSKFGSTEITVKTRVALQARNEKDGSIARMTLNGLRSDSVFWFGPRDVEEAINETLKDSVNRFLADARVENRLLQVQ
jgi:hypothetical protein